jgi:hypothetical protein
VKNQNSLKPIFQPIGVVVFLMFLSTILDTVSTGLEQFAMEFNYEINIFPQLRESFACGRSLERGNKKTPHQGHL